MSTQVSRIQFLRGDYKGKNSPLRPPWAINENLFLETCTACGECISVCPERIIISARGNYPVVDFSRGECSFCKLCVDSCKPQALQKISLSAPWSIKASIDETSCIAYQGIECRACYDPCESRAIKMPPRLGGVCIPMFDTEACSGCGACYSVCPVKAITMNHYKTITTQQ